MAKKPTGFKNIESKFPKKEGSPKKDAPFAKGKDKAKKAKPNFNKFKGA